MSFEALYPTLPALSVYISEIRMHHCEILHNNFSLIRPQPVFHPFFLGWDPR